MLVKMTVEQVDQTCEVLIRTAKIMRNSRKAGDTAKQLENIVNTLRLQQKEYLVRQTYPGV